MQTGPIEIHQPRIVTDHGILESGALVFKVYGLSAPGKAVSQNMITTSEAFIADEVRERVESMGESNDLGFIIIHPGTIGLSISAHWWVQGSVLCQHIYRKHYADAKPLDTINRPVVACVWELALINAEQEAWRKTMMTDRPDRDDYLISRASFSET